MKITTLMLCLLVCSISYGQLVDLSKKELIGLTLKQQVELGVLDEQILISPPSDEEFTVNSVAGCNDDYIPVGSDYIAVPRNDDGSLYIPDIGFTFSFCGSSYTDCYINTNGNISFTQGVSQYSPDGFPYPVPMVAPFWADVDTRNNSCGQAWYKLFTNYMIVTWDSVGWYNQQCAPLNQFQLIISDGTADIIGFGNNVQFRYGDMEWTTGQASGGGPFGGSPATVGYNSGDNENFEQVGRFNVDDSSYDGPYGAHDGVHYLDYQCYVFNANLNNGSGFDLSCDDVTIPLDDQCHLALIASDISSFKTTGCETFDIEMDITDFYCDDIGDHLVTVTVSNDIITESCTAQVSVTEGGCADIFISPVGLVCEGDDPFNLTASPPGGTWTGATQTGTINPSDLGIGIHQVVYTNSTACPDSDMMEFEIIASPAVVVSPEDLSLCESDDPFAHPIIAVGAGGDENYTFTWDTPYGPQDGSVVYPQQAGTYTVIIQDGNLCADEASLEVEVNPNPTVNIEDPGPICANLEIYTLTASPAGGVFNGSIETPEGVIYPNQNAPGSYYANYVLEDINGCIGSNNLLIEIVEEPTALAAATSPVCDGETIILFGNTTGSDQNVNYYWEGPNGYTSTEKTPTDATEAGIYTLQVESQYGCLSELSETEVEIVDAPTVTTLGGSIGCEGVSTQIFAFSDVPNGDFTWEGPNGFNSDEDDPIVMEYGTYYVTVSIGPNCIGVDSTEVIPDNSIPDLEATGNTITCLDNQVQIFANSSTPGVIYEWEGPNGFSSNEQEPLVNEYGDYLVIATGTNGCRDSLSVSVILDAEYATISGELDTLSCSKNELQLNLEVDLDNVDYEWSGPNSFVSSDPSPMITLDGLYYVTVTSDTGCKSYDSIEISIDTIAPALSLAYNTLDCFNPVSTAELSDLSGADQINWNGPNGFSDTGEAINIIEAGDYTVEVMYDNGCSFMESFYVEENYIFPSISADSDTISCTTGFATITGATQTPDTELTWKNSQGEIIGTGMEIMVGSAGIYTCIATNMSTGCKDSIYVDVLQDVNVPDISTTGTTIDCSTTDFYVEANSILAETIEWQGPNGFTSSELNPQVFEPGSYTVTATAVNGCKAVEIVEVIDDTTVPQIELLADVIGCDQPSVNIVMAETGEDNSYSWSGPNGFTSSEARPIVTEGGIYSVTVTSINNCSSEESIEVIKDVTVPSLQTSSSNDLSCLENISTVSASSDDPDATFNWTGPNGFTSTDENFDVLEAGLYMVTVASTNGCAQSTSVEIVIDTIYPGIELQGGVIDCNNPSIIINATLNNTLNPTYSWTGPNGFTSNNEDPVISVAGDYTLVVMNENGCQSNSLILIEDDVEIPETTIDMVGFDCFGSDALLSASLDEPGLIYSWESESLVPYSGKEIAVQEAGLYNLTVTNTENGCEYISSAFLEEVIPVSGFEIDAAEPGCRNDFGSISFISVEGGQGSLAYSVDNGNTFQISPIFENLNPGVYDLVIVDENQCEVYDQIVLEEQMNFELSTTSFYVVQSGEDLDITVDAPIPVNEIESVLWEPALNLSCDNCLDPIFNGYEGVSYTLTVTDINGCSAEAKVDVRVVLKDVYFPNAFSPNGDQVNDFFTVFGDENQIETVLSFSIYDRWGSQIFHNEEFPVNEPSSGWDGNFNGNSVVPGVYVYVTEVKMVNGETRNYFGDVTVMK